MTNLFKSNRGLRPMLHCYFCGGRVIPTKQLTHRCEAEGVSWEVTENLTVYRRYEGPLEERTPRDPRTGKFAPLRVNPIRK